MPVPSPSRLQPHSGERTLSPKRGPHTVPRPSPVASPCSAASSPRPTSRLRSSPSKTQTSILRDKCSSQETPVPVSSHPRPCQPKAWLPWKWLPWALSRPGLEKPTFTCQLLQSPKGPGSPCWAPGCSLHTRKRNPTGHCPLPTAPPTLSSPGRIFSQQRDPAATRLRRGAPGRRQACTGRGRRAWLRAGAPQRLQGAPCGHIQPAHWALQPPARPWVNSTD